MSQTSPPERHEASPPVRRTRSLGARKEDWIANQLRHVYDEALHDAIPQSMIDLLNALDETEESNPDDGERK